MGGGGGGQLTSFNRNSQSLCHALSSGGFYLYCSTFKRLKKPPPSSEMDEELYPHEKVLGDKPGSLRAGAGGEGGSKVWSPPGISRLQVSETRAQQLTSCVTRRGLGCVLWEEEPTPPPAGPGRDGLMDQRPQRQRCLPAVTQHRNCERHAGTKKQLSGSCPPPHRGTAEGSPPLTPGPVDFTS